MKEGYWTLKENEYMNNITMNFNSFDTKDFSGYLIDANTSTNNAAKGNV